jgi:DNA-directed RNA polymerase subunit M
MICPKCKSLLLPIEGEYLCKKCGLRIKREKKIGRIVSIERKEKEIPILDEKTEVLPKIEITCPKCSNIEAYWILRQTRAADEPETKIYTCTKCGYRWRE